jgi:hypothetical protein
VSGYVPIGTRVRIRGDEQDRHDLVGVVQWTEQDGRLCILWPTNVTSLRRVGEIDIVVGVK